MARTPKPVLPNSFIASAALMSGGNLMNNLSRRNNAEAWHSEAWGFYHTIGEFRFGCDWKGSMLSKAILFAQVRKPDGSYTRITTGKAAEYMDLLFGDDDGRAEMLRQMGVHLSVTGDLWIVGYENPDKYGEPEVWQVVASTRLSRPSSDRPEDHYRINGVEIPVDQDKVLCIRIWIPDPEDAEKSISPARAVLSILGEIARLTDHVAAQVDSRLAGAGILLMPSEMTIAGPPTTEGSQQTTANSADELMKKITQAMQTAIRDRSNPSALVPIVITAPAEVIDKIKHVTFWSELSEQAMELRKEAIGRLALGMDIPPEVLQGVAESNHWSAWQADESAIKAHTEPLLKLITTGLTQKYLRPLLDGEEGFDELRSYNIGVDTSEMRIRPNRSKEALELYNLGELSGTALRRETGFDEADAPTKDELAEWFKRKVASGSTTPELVQAALEELGVHLNVKVEEPATEGRPAPSLEDHPTRDIPDREIGQRRKDARDRGDVPSADVARRAASLDQASMVAAALAVGSEQAIFRALERAGNRMRNKMGGKLGGVPARDTYLTFGVQTGDLDFYLDDAWGDNVSALASHAGISTGQLKAALDGYCRALLVSQQPHSFERLERHLRAALRQEVAA